MNGYWAFVKKEFLEYARTYKLLILGLVFLLFGLMNPLTAKFTPDLLGVLAPEGLQITLPEPTALDAWAQFFKNVSQIGLIVLVVLFSGMLATEFAKGTLVQMLTKGLSRSAVLLAKWTGAAVLWTGAYGLCFAVTGLYTLYFWREGVATGPLLHAVLALWLFGLLLLSALLLGGVLWKTHAGGLLFVGGFVVLLFVLNVFPVLRGGNPIALAADNLTLVQGEAEAGALGLPACVAVGLSAAFVAVACVVFRRKQL